MAMFLKLKALRDQLASVPAFRVDAETRKALVEAIDELDDAMVADLRAERYARMLPEPTDLTPEYLAMFAGSATTGELVA